MNLTAPHLDVLLPAFLAGIVVLSTHVPLGQQALARGVVFLGLAVAQLAGLGLVVADLLGWNAAGWATQLMAFVAAALGASLLAWTDARWPATREALIGVLVVLTASAVLVLLAHSPHGGEHLKDLLVGRILAVSRRDLLRVDLLYIAVFFAWLYLRGRLGPLGFYLMFSLTVAASVPLVGIYLVFGSLIVPALAVRDLPRSLRLPVGYVVGVLGYLAGLVLSAMFDLPAGPVIVCSLIVAMPIVRAAGRPLHALVPADSISSSGGSVERLDDARSAREHAAGIGVANGDIAQPRPTRRRAGKAPQ